MALVRVFRPPLVYGPSRALAGSFGATTHGFGAVESSPETVESYVPGTSFIIVCTKTRNYTAAVHIDAYQVTRVSVYKVENKKKCKEKASLRESNPGLHLLARSRANKYSTHFDHC